MKLEVSRVILFAANMERMTRFYETTLGLSRLETADDSAEFISFDAGGCHLSLHAIPDAIAATILIEEPPKARAETPIKLVFGAVDVDAVRAELVSRGAAMGPVNRFEGLHLCDGLDPEGNVFQISNRGAS